MRRKLEEERLQRESAAAAQQLQPVSNRQQFQRARAVVDPRANVNVKRESTAAGGKQPKVFSVRVAPGSVGIAKFEGDVVPNFGDWNHPITVQKVPVLLRGNCLSD